ncbi:MAG TPA: glycosyltransferase family 2 protein [Methylophilaceae bacterium]|nr:glycosyltransferase family 2 protein [Methylophilaceae bacterium]
MRVPLPPISILIPNYNGAHLLIKNLPSVIEASKAYPSHVDLIVVDDGSADNSLTILSTNFPEIKVVAHAENKGFSEAIFSGVQAAETEVMFLLNTDVQINADCLKVLAGYFADLGVFSVSPLILNENEVVSRHSWNRREFKFGKFSALDWELTKAQSIRKQQKLPALYTSGGSMMVRKSMFMQLKGFHPLYKPFYSEDFDLGLRAWRRGWPSYFEPNVSVVHQSKGSIKENVKRAYVKQVRRRNHYILEWSHIPVTRLFTSVFLYTAWKLLGEIILLDKTNLKGFITALPRIKEIVRFRLELKSTEVYGLDEVLEKLK